MNQPRSQAAVIAVHGGKVCLITSRRRFRWVIPKGCMESGKTPAEIAVQEAWEEAGIVGVLRRDPLGTYDYEKTGNRYRVTVFYMEVTRIEEDWPERLQRTRRWLPGPAALLQIEEAGLRQLMHKVLVAELDALTA